jgi:hypothetical protein
MTTGKITLEKVKEYGEIFKTWIEAFTGKKDIKSKVDVLASPDNKKSMSVLTRQQTNFVSLSYFLVTPTEWGGLFDGMKILSDEMMEVSPSVQGVGREQVIRFVGAISESKMLKSLGLTVSKEEEKASD